MSYEKSPDAAVVLDPDACNGLEQRVNGLYAAKPSTNVLTMSPRFWTDQWDGTGFFELPVRSATFTNTDPCRAKRLSARVIHGQLWAGPNNLFTDGSSFRAYPRASGIGGVTPPAAPGYSQLYSIVHQYVDTASNDYVAKFLGDTEFVATVAPGASWSISVGLQLLSKQGAAWPNPVRFWLYGERIIFDAESV